MRAHKQEKNAWLSSKLLVDDTDSDDDEMGVGRQAVKGRRRTKMILTAAYVICPGLDLRANHYEDPGG